MILEEETTSNMEVLYPSNLALLSMFLKNPERNSNHIISDDRNKKEDCADVLTCGSCQKDFLLADILRFIQHKVHCHGSASSESRLNSEEDEISPQRSNKSKDLNGYLTDGGDAPSPRSPSSPLDQDTDRDDKRKRDEEDESTPRKKAKTVQDAEANTVNSEPAKYTCGTCGSVLSSAWGLVQHVQSSHGIIIYQETTGLPVSSPCTPPGIPKPSHSSPLASVSSTATTSSTPIPPLPISLLDPTKVDLSKMVSPVSSVGSLPTHPQANTPLLDPSHPFNFLRMPLGDARTPFPPGLTPPFIRPGHDFRMDQLFPEALRLNPNLLPPTFDRQPFLDPGLGAARPPAPTPLSSGGDPNLEFYSHRLRQLAGTTSPTSSTSPKKPIPSATPPFTSPRAPTPSTPARAQTPTSSRTDGHQKPALHKCDVCEKLFRWESNLMIHSRIHTGEKEFRCSICQDTFPVAQSLRSHLKTHRKISNKSGTSPDSSRPFNEEGNGEDEEEEQVEEDNEEQDNNLSVADSMDEDENHNRPEQEEDEPEDLSTSKSSAGDSSISQNVSSSCGAKDSNKLDNQNEQPKSVVGELMDKFGLSNISTYSEAYQQALKESSRFFPHQMGREGTKLPPTNGYEKTLKIREDLTKNLLNNQSSLELTHQTLLNAFDNPFEAQKRLAAAAREQSGLYAGLWLPGLGASGGPPRDLFSGHHPSDSNFMQRKLTDGLLKHESAVSGTRVSSNSSPSTPLSLVQAPKKESRRNDTCEYCGKIFKNCSNLTVHRRSHTGEKPYKCDLCSYACAQSSKLTRHMKTHGRIGKDVYRCRFCDMPFSVASTLEKHMRKCVVNQNSKGLFPPISSANPDGLDTYKGFHLTSVISDESAKSGLFGNHFSATVPSVSDDAGDSSNLSGPGS